MESTLTDFPVELRQQKEKKEKKKKRRKKKNNEKSRRVTSKAADCNIARRTFRNRVPGLLAGIQFKNAKNERSGSK